MGLSIEKLDKSGYPDWNRYVNECRDATVFHLAEWKDVLEKSFSYPVFYHYAMEDGHIAGVLPLARVKTLLFGDALVSTPCCVYGGSCADNERISLALENRAVELAESLGVGYLELRQSVRTGDSWSCNRMYSTFRKRISADQESNMKSIPRKQRAMIRKGMDAGLCSVVDDNIDRFYSIYSVSVRNLGTPVYPRRYFEHLYEIFSGRCDVLTVEKAGKPVSSVFSLYYRDSVLPYYAGGLPVARKCKAYDFMYWELMRRNAEKGYSMFDFGRSIEGSGSYHFKKNWGFIPEPLYYRQYLVKANELPRFDPGSSRYSLYVNIWKHLPLGIANLLGPVVSRGLV